MKWKLERTLKEASCLVRSMEIIEKPLDIRYADQHSNEFNYKRISLRQLVLLFARTLAFYGVFLISLLGC